MPQLNLYTYFSQVTWLIIIFSLYYIYMKEVVITTLLEKLEIRKQF